MFRKEWREGGGREEVRKPAWGRPKEGEKRREEIEECKGVSPPPLSWGEGEVKGMHRARQVGSIRVDQSGPAGWLQTRPTPAPLPGSRRHSEPPPHKPRARGQDG